jgi:holliday junction DNA helicase RuvA
MIGTIRGNILFNDEDGLVVEVNGIGYLVHVPSPVRNQLRAGENVLLYTKLVVREDSLTLYGFDSKDSREIFDLLLGVNGVGPRLALSILSTLESEVIRRAIYNEQLDLFSRVPGVGKKTAQKIFIHLQDRIPAVSDLSPVARFSELDNDMLEALISLGYSVVEAQSAIQFLPRDAPEDIEERLRLALQYLGGR